MFEVATPELWLVSFGADDDRELSAKDIEAALAERRIGKSTLVWRDGMPEWLPLSRVPELAALLPHDPARPPPPRPKAEPATEAPAATDLTGGFLGTGLAVPEDDRDFQVVALSSRLADSGKHELAAEAAKDETPPPSSSGFLEADALEDAPPSIAKPQVSAPPPAPRRSTAPHGGETRSLPQAKKAPLAFTEAPSDAGAASDAEPETPPPSSTGVPDLRALAAQSVAPRRPSPAAIGDDLESKLAAAAAAPKGVVLESAPSNPRPVLEPDSAPSNPKPVALESRESSPPVSRRSPQPKKSAKSGTRERKDVRSVAPSATVQQKASPKRSSSTTWLLLGAALLLGFVWLGTRKPPRAAEPVAAVTQPAPAPAPEAPAQPVAPAPEPSAAPEASAEPEPEPEPADTTVANARVRENPPPTTESVEAAASAALEPTAGTPADVDAGAPAAGDGEPETTFDRSAAVAALALTANEAAGCRKPGDPDGNATVVITFAPSGRVTSAVVEGPPFAGTATGGCVATTMRKTTVPPFEGAYARVTRQVWVK